MTRFLKPALLVFIFGALFASCEKEFSTENGITPGGNVGSGCKSCSYIPWCNGSTYTYIDTAFGGAATTVNSSLNIVGDTVINGLVYSKTVVDGETSYHNCNNGVTTIGQNDGTGLALATFLKENLAVGATWTDLIPIGGGANQTDAYKIISKGGSRTVLGVTYNDVIHVQLISSIEVPFIGNLETGKEENYYANNIGLIDSYITESITGTLVLHRVLQSYNIP